MDMLDMLDLLDMLELLDLLELWIFWRARISSACTINFLISMKAQSR
jgi:hypothetical protein